MKRVLLSIFVLVILWVGVMFYRGYSIHPKVIWEGNKIVDVQNCERPNQNYNTQCSRVYCEYEIRKMDEVQGFIDLSVIQVISTSLKPSESKHLVEVVMPYGEIYFMCEMQRDIVETIERTTKNDFEIKNSL